MAHTEQSAHHRGSLAGRNVLLVWGLVRVPLILVLLFLFREPISALPIFDGDTITVRIIDLLSLPVSRGLLFIALLAAFGGLVFISLRMRSINAYAFLVGVTLAATLMLFWATQTPLRHAIIPVIFAATNFLPAALLQRHLGSPVMAVGVGAAEALTVRRYAEWLAGLANLQRISERTLSNIGWALAAIVVSASMVLLAKGGQLIPIEQAFRMPATANVLMREDINGLSLDAETRRLYATGHGLETVIEFNLDDLGQPPRVSEVDSGGSQSMFRNVRDDELIVYDGEKKQLLLIDAETLALTRKIDVPQISSGDPWFAFDPISNTIALVSEADIEDGIAFLLIDYATGDVLDSRPLDGGNVLKHPDKPWLYLSFFRRNPEILVYDMEKRDVIERRPAPARLDRMIILPETGELLVTSPVKSEVLRLDADTLASKGVIKAPFGVRTLAVDAERELLFAGSFVTGQIAVIDTNTGRSVKTVYLGPWLRSIELDVGAGTAYVSSNGALYSWSYEQGH